MPYKRDATYSGYTQDAEYLVEQIIAAWERARIGPGEVSCRTDKVQVTVKFYGSAEPGTRDNA